MTSVLESRGEALSDHDSVLASAEAIRIFGRNVVRAQLAAGRWQSPHRGVVVMHNGPLPDAQRTWARLLACPPGSALAGLTALRFDDFEGFDQPLDQVVVPEGGRRLRVSGV